MGVWVMVIISHWGSDLSFYHNVDMEFIKPRASATPGGEVAAGFSKRGMKLNREINWQMRESQPGLPLEIAIILHRNRAQPRVESFGCCWM
jgi:hypothetical protein